MKKIIVFPFLFWSFLIFGQKKTQFDNLAEMVNPLMGTDSERYLSNGNTLPLIGMPWGMNYWTPQTGKLDTSWIYQNWIYTYNANKIRGFRQTHQPSVWLGDYGTYSIMPVTGTLKVDETDRASWFSHKTEICKPYYYSVYLADHNVKAELTATERAGQFLFSYPETDSAFVVVDAFDKGSYVKIIPEERTIVGYSEKYSFGELKNFRNYFVLKFDKDFENYGSWNQEEGFVYGKKEMNSEHSISAVGFKTGKDEKVSVKTASSFISFDQAFLNLDRELKKDDFKETKAKVKKEWNERLSTIEVEGDNIDHIRTFYSAFYRTMLYPMKLYEIDKQEEKIHWSPFDGEVYKGYMFAGTGFWDTFRSLYPLLNLVFPDINRKMQMGLINAYKEGGVLPEWSTPGYGLAMVGNHSASVVADAYIKGLRGYDIETLYEALVAGSKNDSVSRVGLHYYDEMGYIPMDVGIKESASRTLEYAYDDFAIYQLGKALKKPKKEIERYLKSSRRFSNLFDAKTLLMTGKKENGEFDPGFNPFKWGDPFTEANSWQYTWSVFHDFSELQNLMGGRDVFIKMLDSLFKLPPEFDVGVYGEVIHEIREMQVGGMGQLALGNQPSQHIPYLYNYAGQPWKTQFWVRESMEKLFNSHPDGYPGDEDNGQTGSWYVFSALGFYPVTPATDQYIIGSPLFKKATIYLSNGKKIHINAENNSPKNFYVDDLKLNQTNYGKNWLSHFDLIKGADLDFKMTGKPNKKRGINEADMPYSYTKDK